MGRQSKKTFVQRCTDGKKKKKKKKKKNKKKKNKNKKTAHIA